MVSVMLLLPLLLLLFMQATVAATEAETVAHNGRTGSKASADHPSSS